MSLRKQNGLSQQSGENRYPANLKEDPLVAILRSGKYPSPSQIREYRGESTVSPFILTEAVYFRSEPRRTNESEIVHPANTQTRGEHWNLGFGNKDIDQIISIYNHDWGENLSLGTVEGNHSIVRLIGHKLVFGPQHYEPALALTNIRRTIFGGLENKLSELHDPLPDYIVKTLIDLYRGINADNSQTRVYSHLYERVQAFKESRESFGWGEQDQREVVDLLNPFLHAIESLSKNQLPTEYIREHTTPLLQHFEADAKNPNSSMLSPDCVLRHGQSVLMHNLDHLQYDRYLEDLLEYAIRDTQPSNPKASNKFGYIAMKTKLQESTDNLIKEGEKNPYRQHIAHYKGIRIGEIGDRYLQHLRSVHDSRVHEFELVLNFEKHELLRRVIKDYCQAKTEHGPDNRPTVAWLIQEFGLARKYVKGSIEEAVLTTLNNERRHGDPLEKERAETLLLGYEQLVASLKTPSQSKPLFMGKFNLF